MLRVLRALFLPTTAFSIFLLLAYRPTASPAAAGVGPYIYLPLVARQLPATPTLIPPTNLANEQAIASLINQQRTSNHLPPYNPVSQLTQAARRHRLAMAGHNFTSHTGSDGSDGGQRIRDAGYNWAAWAEIIGWGFGGDPVRMMNWWMNSPVHKATILSTNQADFGVGYAMNPNSTYIHYWTVDFGRRPAGTQLVQDTFMCTFESYGPEGGTSVIISSPLPCD